MTGDDDQLKFIAATTVAASIAMATAKYINTESNSTKVGVQVAQMTAQVADAVAKGDADTAVKLIIAVANDVDRSTSYSNVNECACSSTVLQVALETDINSNYSYSNVTSSFCSIL